MVKLNILSMRIFFSLFRPSQELCFLLAQRSSILPVEMGIYGFGTAILVNVMVWSILEGKLGP